MARHFVYIGLLITSYLGANPTTPTVVQGAATFSGGVGTLTVNSQNPVTAINWDTFSVGTGETLNFTYLNGSGVGDYYVLNTATGGSATNIIGTLNAAASVGGNGNIYIINPAGITIASSGVIMAGSFLASTLQLASSPFDPTNPMTFTGSSQTSVTNLGVVTATVGDVTFIGYQVIDSGTINACDTVAFGAGLNLLVQPGNSDRILILTNSTASATATGISSGGTISAESVYLKADGNLYSLAINQTGSINIAACLGSVGAVTMIADPLNGCGGLVQVSGTIISSSDVLINGNVIDIQAGALINTSATGGAGSITIGTLTGTCPTANVYVNSTAQLLANASVTGTGGTVTISANNSLLFLGTLQATGVSSGGSGNFTCNGYLGVNGSVLFTSTSGVFGTLSLTNSDIIVGGVANYGTNYSPTLYTTGTVDSMITTTALLNALTNGNLSITAQGYYPAESTITVSDNFTWSSGTTLSLAAGNTIQVNAKGTMTGTGVTASTPIIVMAAPIINLGLSSWPTSMTAVQTGFTTASGAVQVTFGDQLNLYGGGISDTESSLKGVNIIINSTTSGTGDILVSGSSCSRASINGASVLIGQTTNPNSLTILGGSCSSNNESYIGSLTTGSNIAITLAGDLNLVGGTVGMRNRASIISSGSGANSIAISAYDINLTGGASGSSLNEARIMTSGNLGSVTLTTARDLYITGGASVSGSAYVSGGSATATVGRDLIMTGGTASSSSAYISANSGVTGTINRFLILQGGSAQAADSYISVTTGDINLGASSNDAQFIFNGGNISSATNGFAHLQVTNGGNINIGQSNNAPNYINLIAGYGGNSFANPSASFIIDGDGSITVTALTDINFLGGSGGYKTIASSRLNGTGEITFTTGRDMNMKTGNDLSADVYLFATNGLINVNASRDFNMTGSCSIPNIAYLTAKGVDGAVEVIVGRDFTMTEKTAITIDNPTVSNPSDALLIAVGNTWTHIGCPVVRVNEIYILPESPTPTPTPVPTPVIPVYPADKYYRYVFLYELFYRLNYFNLYDWFEFQNYSFWDSANYVAPGN